jgi:hypothetical protein
MIGPGLLVAATGVGAGDLATASFAGSLLGSSGECSAGCFFPTCCSGHFLLRRP